MRVQLKSLRKEADLHVPIVRQQPVDETFKSVQPNRRETPNEITPFHSESGVKVPQKAPCEPGLKAQQVIELALFPKDGCNTGHVYVYQLKASGNRIPIPFESSRHGPIRLDPPEPP